MKVKRCEKCFNKWDVDVSGEKCPSCIEEKPKKKEPKKK